MCVHEIIALGFQKSFFEPQHMFRDCVSGSLHGWTPQPQDPTAIESMLDYEVEPIMDAMAACSFDCDESVFRGNNVTTPTEEENVAIPP